MKEGSKNNDDWDVGGGLKRGNLVPVEVKFDGSFFTGTLKSLKLMK